jgi:chloramphenicol 3-O phosphotransferase
VSDLRVIIVNGASSTGKTSLIRALQNLLVDDWLTFGTDSLITAMPLRLDGHPDGLMIYADGRVTIGPAYKALEVSWRHGLAAMARAGVRLVLDEVMLGGADEQRLWFEALDGVNTLWVGVRCDPAVAAAREMARGDRVVGMSALQAGPVHAGVTYDLEIDTSDATPDDCARLIADRVGD